MSDRVVQRLRQANLVPLLVVLAERVRQLVGRYDADTEAQRFPEPHLEPRIGVDLGTAAAPEGSGGPLELGEMVAVLAEEIVHRRLGRRGQRQARLLGCGAGRGQEPVRGAR